MVYTIFMKILKLSIVLNILLATAFAQSPPTDQQLNAAQKKYMDYVTAVKAELGSFNEKLRKGEVCPNFDFKCLENEMSKTEIKSSVHATVYMVIITSHFLNAKKAKGTCDQKCNNELFLKMLDIQTKLISKFDAKKLHTYAKYQNGDSDYKLLQMMEELSFHDLFQLYSSKTFGLLAKLDQLSLNPEQKILYSEVANRATALTEGHWFLDGALGTLNLEDPKGPDTKLFLNLPNAKGIEAMETFKTKLVKAKVKNQVKN